MDDLQQVQEQNHPCYQESVYAAVMYDESPDGDLIQCDMTQILLNQEKYRDRKSTRLNSSHITRTRMPSSA